MLPILEKCSLSNEKDAERVSVNTPCAQMGGGTRGSGGKESRKLDLRSSLGKLLLIPTASASPVNVCLPKS